MVLSIIHSERVRIQADQVEMEGVLRLPEDHAGVILFAHGGAGSRLNPPHDYVESVLRDARLCTLWLDLLTPQEARSQHMRIDSQLLTHRLNAACDWLRQQGATSDLPISLFGTCNAAAPALQLAAERGHDICAVVSRGGRPNLANQGVLGKISAPTLLIVGGLDDGAIDINRAVYAALRCKKRFEIIPGATRTFDEPGSVEVVARLTRGWILQHTHLAYA